jgi:hypothetical protein
MGVDMMAAAGVGGALVAEAWANKGALVISWRAGPGRLCIMRGSLCGDSKTGRRKRVGCVFEGVASGTHQPKLPRW